MKRGRFTSRHITNSADVNHGTDDIIMLTSCWNNGTGNSTIPEANLQGRSGHPQQQEVSVKHAADLVD
eukprot:scaffold19879_cov174-Amphora_coffeaeformis.AAC.2